MADPTAAPLAALAARLGYPPGDHGLLRDALTHKSYANEIGGLPHNERLEFLGDAVLGMIVADALMRAHPTASEGTLSRLRAGLVNSRSLAEAARKLDLGLALRLGKGETRTGGAEKASLLADAFEATLGAMHRDLGYGASRRLVLTVFGDQLGERETRLEDRDYKTRLQELSQAQFQETPAYEVVAEEGPDHEKAFEVSVFFDGKIQATGRGRSKKAAARDAARVAWDTMHQTPTEVS